LSKLNTQNNKIQTVHIDRLALCLLPPPPSSTEEQTSEQETLLKQTAEAERRSTRSRKPPLIWNPMSKNKYTANANPYLADPAKSPKNQDFKKRHILC